MVEGNVVPLVDVCIGQGETEPKGHLSESELIERMEKNGIGTDAPIPTHINNICVRRYCNTDQGRHMVPTNLGILLVQVSLQSSLCVGFNSLTTLFLVMIRAIN